jgi:hypothetical protein
MLKEESIKVSTVGFFNQTGKTVKKPTNELTYYYFDPKDANWLGQVKLPLILELLNKPFDLMIDLNTGDHFCLQYLAALSKAQFKVGASGSYRDQVCDLTFKIEPLTSKKLIQEMKKYLALINRKTA